MDLNSNKCCAADFIPVSELRSVQLARLQKIVEHAYNNVDFFRNRMNEMGVKPSDIKALEDIQKLPFSKKIDLRDTYPFGLCAVPMSEVVRLHASSGTTGKPIVVAYTKEDLNVWMEVMRRGLAGAG